jgi:hypothetical protein
MDNLKDTINNCVNKICNVSTNIPTSEAPNVNKENVYIKSLLNELMSKRYFYKVHNESLKILTIFACHSNSENKYNAVINNFDYLKFPNNDIIIINSSNESYSEKLKNDIQDKCKSYFEIPNDVFMDFGKWNYVCSNFDISNYDFIVFTNDSYFITSSIYPFYNMMIEKNTNLYGINSSSEIKYHYQSYLFGLKNCAVQGFKNLFNLKKNLINNSRSLIDNLELNLENHFIHKDCFLKVEEMPTNAGKNICFHNDLLYSKLLKTRVFPIIKFRRIDMLTD